MHSENDRLAIHRGNLFERSHQLRKEFGKRALSNRALGVVIIKAVVLRRIVAKIIESRDLKYYASSRTYWDRLQFLPRISCLFSTLSLILQRQAYCWTLDVETVLAFLQLCHTDQLVVDATLNRDTCATVRTIPTTGTPGVELRVRILRRPCIPFSGKPVSRCLKTSSMTNPSVKVCPPFLGFCLASLKKQSSYV